ncbi:hypothetical protein TeGR_g12120 [Tetraparma gracilis]|uniref:2,4-dienoyl-CoA reductase [(3E)-enoyl-CoA-producing] n=1 Tax=Tetraparma gracilis TaxID=2962635 RepID=A0ABQ6M876_9STRA|nr:hypothetical protein TeGR_g12120 [Tetraparma gracilis]
MSLPSPFLATALSHEVCIVTGASGEGICLTIARCLLEHGAVGVVICGRREQVLRQSAASLVAECCPAQPERVAYRVCDVRSPDACHRLVEFTVGKYGRLTTVVNGAAGNFLSTARNLSPNGFKTVMEIDVCGTFNMCHAAFKALSSAASAPGSPMSKIVNISATLQYGATHYQVHASAAKAAIDSMTRTLALEWGAHGIRVNGVAPGPIAGTPGLTKLAGGALDAGALEEMVAEVIPLGRMGEKRDIGTVVVFLCCNGSGSAYVSGETIVCDGGAWLWKPAIVEADMVDAISRTLEKKKSKL